MGLVWTPEALPAFIAHFVAWAAAIWLFKAAPQRRQNRLLALVLMIEGVTVGFGGGWMYLSDDPRVTYAGQAVVAPFGMALFPAYLLFLGTLDTRAARPLRSLWGRIILWSMMAAGPLLWVLASELFVAGVEPGDFSPWNATTGPLSVATVLTFMLQSIIGLVYAVLNLRSAAPGPLRKQARAFLAAFAIRDLSFIATVVFYIIMPNVLPPAWPGVIMPGLTVLVYIPVLALGVLRTQLFGIDLQIKRAVRGSTLAAPFAAAFFVATETLENVLPFESYWAGLAAAGVLALAVAPLQRAAHGLAERLMPGVEESDDYRGRRALEIYAAAWESAGVDGVVTGREQAMLDRLAAEFGLAPDARRRVEARR